jgi:isopentenyl-diphosphate delta-isomerase
MTGGTDEAGRINRELSSIAEERGYGFGLGSQRAMMKRPEDAWVVRPSATWPRTCSSSGTWASCRPARAGPEALEKLVADVGADALCVHMNPAHGARATRRRPRFPGDGAATLRALVQALPFPIVAKETGSGISRGLGRRLRASGVKHVDVSGAGGTSWVAVETKRAASANDEPSRKLGDALWDWGIPTAASVLEVAPLGFETVIATGGVKTGMDVAKAVALGATAAGIARPVLVALREGGRAGAIAALEGIERELRAVMLLTGSRTLGDLRRARPCC